MLVRRLAIEQLEIAKNLILHDTVSSLRIALILLDNFVEILMLRKINEHVDSDNFIGPAIAKMSDLELPPHLLKIKRQLLSEKSKWKLKHNFPEKIRYLSTVHDDIPHDLGEFLNALHIYRNDAYHNAQVKNEIIKPVTLLLFGICCDLFLQLTPNYASWSSDFDEEDWTRFFAQYDIVFHASIMGNRDVWNKVIRKLRENMGIHLADLQKSLVTYLSARIADTSSLIDFLNKDMPAKQVDFPYTKPKLRKWQRQLPLLAKTTDKIQLFNLYSGIENDFHPFEEKVAKLASELDQWIQMQIDIARGK